MPSRIDSICREVRDLLNEAPHGTYSGLYANWASFSLCEWRHLPNYDAGTLDALKVVVSAQPEDSLEWNAAVEDRCCGLPFSFRVYVAILHKLRTFDELQTEYSDSDEFEACKELVESIAEYVYGQPLTVGLETFGVREMNFEPFWDRTMLYENRIFKSVLNLVYQ